jgi:hypothetical protein
MQVFDPAAYRWMIGQHTIAGIKLNPSAKITVNIKQSVSQPINHFTAQKVMGRPILCRPPQTATQEPTVKNLWWLHHTLGFEKTVFRCP